MPQRFESFTHDNLEWAYRYQVKIAIVLSTQEHIIFGLCYGAHTLPHLDALDTFEVLCDIIHMYLCLPCSHKDQFVRQVYAFGLVYFYIERQIKSIAIQDVDCLVWVFD